MPMLLRSMPLHALMLSCSILSSCQSWSPKDILVSPSGSRCDQILVPESRSNEWHKAGPRKGIFTGHVAKIIFPIFSEQVLSRRTLFLTCNLQAQLAIATLFFFLLHLLQYIRFVSLSSTTSTCDHRQLLYPLRPSSQVHSDRSWGRDRYLPAISESPLPDIPSRQTK